MIRKEWCVWVLLLAAAVLTGGRASATNFAILLDDGRDDDDAVYLEGVDEVEIEDLTWDVKELSATDLAAYAKEDPDLARRLQSAQSKGHRLYGPGRPHWGNAKFTARCGMSGSKELQAWFQEAAKGKNIRKNITVKLFKSNKLAGRTYTLFDCFPVAYTAGNCTDPASAYDTDVFEVSVGGGDLASPSDEPDASARVALGIKTSTVWSTPDRALSWSGGEPVRLQTEAVAGGAFRINSPGHKTVGEITLRIAPFAPTARKGYDKYKELADELSGAARWLKSLTITESLPVNGGVKDGKQYIYYDCFPIRYVFPRISASNTTGNTMEEVTIKPIRLELK